LTPHQIGYRIRVAELTMRSLSMTTFKFVAAPIVVVSLVMGSLVAWAASAGASEPPPVVLRNPRAVVHLAPGASFTFRASAEDAETVLWVVKSPDGSSRTFYSGDNTMTKQGVLKSAFTFGPFNAAENGWEVGAAFVNDPTGVPTGIQESDTGLGLVVLKKTPKG
jgi:hypothetical protein